MQITLEAWTNVQRWHGRDALGLHRHLHEWHSTDTGGTGEVLKASESGLITLRGEWVEIDNQKSSTKCCPTGSAFSNSTPMGASASIRG